VARIDSLIVDRLVTRLRIEAWYAERGDDAARGVEGPLVVFGLPAHGHDRAALSPVVDPQFRYLRFVGAR